jgi:hypothetical protein
MGCALAKIVARTVLEAVGRTLRTKNERGSPCCGRLSQTTCGLRCQLDPVARAITPLRDSVRPGIAGFACKSESSLTFLSKFRQRTRKSKLSQWRQGRFMQTRSVSRSRTQNLISAWEAAGARSTHSLRGAPCLHERSPLLLCSCRTFHEFVKEHVTLCVPQVRMVGLDQKI